MTRKFEAWTRIRAAVVVRDGGLVVAEVGAVGGADLDQGGAALTHDVRDAEAAADLDELAARNHDLAVAGEGREHEEQGGGVVVDGHGGLGAGDAAQEGLDVLVAAAALAGFEVVLEVAVAARDCRHGGDGGVRERRAAEVGVNDDAGGVDHGTQGRGQGRIGAAQGGVDDLVEGVRRLAGGDGGAPVGQLVAHGPGGRFGAELARGAEGALVEKDAVYGGKRTELGDHSKRILAGRAAVRAGHTRHKQSGDVFERGLEQVQIEPTLADQDAAGLVREQRLEGEKIDDAVVVAGVVGPDLVEQCLGQATQGRVLSEVDRAQRCGGETGAHLVDVGALAEGAQGLVHLRLVEHGDEDVAGEDVGVAGAGGLEAHGAQELRRGRAPGHVAGLFVRRWHEVMVAARSAFLLHARPSRRMICAPKRSRCEAQGQQAVADVTFSSFLGLDRPWVVVRPSPHR